MAEISVQYVDHLGDDLRVVNAARVSFDKESKIFTYRKTHPRSSDEGLLQYLAKHNHWTPFSHPMITLRENVPIFVARQRFKHIVGFTYNEVSRRYVDDEPEFYVPEVWRSRPEGSVKQGSGQQEVSLIFDPLYEEPVSIDIEYDWLLSRCLEMYNSFLKNGVAPEMARMLLPQSMMTSYYVTGSLAAFARAYKQRIDNHAQKEIQDLAVQWDKIIRPLFPQAWSALVDDPEPQTV